MKRIEKGKTKIVATIGPATESEEIIKTLIIKGLDVARLNTKHNEPDWHLEMIRKIRRISKECDHKVGILLDLQGPEIRAENFNESKVNIEEGKDYFLVHDTPKNENEIKIPFKNVIGSLDQGNEISLDNGSVSFSVIEKLSDKLRMVAQNSYTLGHRKTVNIPYLQADIPSLTERDKEYLEIIKTEPIDFVGLSFVRNTDDIHILKEYLTKVNSKAHIIAKIETKLALDNIEEIIKVSDALMIARGDLGIENPIEEIAYWQKKIIRLCRQAHTPVIVATQMLKSMTDSPTPSRAEATDIANAVFDGTDAIMLSEETAIGNYPEKAVYAMAKISHFNERHSECSVNFSPTTLEVTEVFAKAAANFTEKGDVIGLDKILVFTDSGFSACAISAFRPKYEIIAVTDKEYTANQMSLIYGVTPYLTELPDGEVHLEDIPFKKLMSDGVLKEGESVLVLHGSKWKTSGTSNLLAFVKI